MQILKQLLPFQYKRKIKENLGVPSLHWSLQNIKKVGFNPGFAIDIGAYKGTWTTEFLEVFPGTKVLMLEAQASKEPFLKKVCESRKNLSYEIALLGADKGGKQYFLEVETGSHVQRSEEITSKTKEMHTSTLDDIIEKGNYPKPDFIKVDVQGFELEVLKGGKKALDACEVCMLEVSLIEIIPECPLLSEVLIFMNERNFEPYDVTELMRRPFDKALFQLDVMFVKKSSRLLESKRWI